MVYKGEELWKLKKISICVKLLESISLCPKTHHLKNSENEEEILSLITSTYMVNKKDARKDLDDFLKQLEAADII